VVARRRAIDEWRRIRGDARHPRPDLVALTDRHDTGREDTYPSDVSPVEEPWEVAARWAGTARELVIFEVLAAGGTKRHAAAAICRDPGRVSQLLDEYRRRVS
jgi:hypothetical protein